MKLCDELNAMCAKFGGGKLAMRGKYIGRIGAFRLGQKIKGEWDLGI